MRDTDITQIETPLGAVDLNPPPDLTSILAFVGPIILETRDRGEGRLAPLPLAGTPDWESASDRVKWAAIAVLALEAVWATERGPTERIAYSESVERVAAEINWAGYGYETGYEAGRRDQAAIERRTRRNAEKRRSAAA
ncbi:hypothetical protein [Rhodococcoides fascians]|uniref:hypothetical protein n=1 Tax=Rhodococcoides fascians TaxID=1828 RepID=UPI0037983EA7